MTWLFDTHIHLSDSDYSEDIEIILNQMKFLQIKSCCVSMNYANSIETFNLSKKSNLILPFLGIHPEFASEKIEDCVELITKNHSEIMGIGEIGLDPTYCKNDTDYPTQKNVFETFLTLAEKFQKPVSIHSRKSLDDIFDLMSSFSTKHALLHWFDGSKKQLQKAMDLGFYVSFGPVSVYADDKKSLISKTNLSQILVETDGPVRFSRCFEMKSGQITFIPSVIFNISKVLKMTYDDMVKILEKNSNAYLGI